MLSKTDKRWLHETYTPRSEVRELIEYMAETYATKQEMFTAFDSVMGELKAIREELAAMSFRLREHSDQLEHIETRLSNLEKHRSNTSNH